MQWINVLCGFWMQNYVGEFYSTQGFWESQTGSQSSVDMGFVLIHIWVNFPHSARAFLFCSSQRLSSLNLALNCSFGFNEAHTTTQNSWHGPWFWNVEQCCVEQGGALLRKLTFWYFDGAQPIRWCCVLTSRKYEFSGARDTINTCRRAPQSAAFELVLEL